MPKITMYSTGVCPYCQMAERLLKAKGVTEIEKVRIDLDPVKRDEMMEKTGRAKLHQAPRGHYCAVERCIGDRVGLCAPIQAPLLHGDGGELIKEIGRAHV